MSEASLGIVVVGGLAGILVLAIGILRVLNRRAASRARHHRPFDPSYHPPTPKEIATRHSMPDGRPGI
jgi:hypothetical protein